jgi:ATP/maltotriose-dependent transcriptional regulator MalT
MGGHYVSAHDHLLEVSKYKSRVMPGVRTHLMAIQGECLLRLGQLAQARSVFDECLKAATASETPQYMAFALFGKARACDERSQESATQALSIYTRIGHIHEHTVSAWLQNAKWNPSILNRFKLWIPV